MTWKSFFLTMLPGSLLVYICHKLWTLLEYGFTLLRDSGIFPLRSFSSFLFLLLFLLIVVAAVCMFWLIAMLFALLPISAIIQSEQDK